MKVLITGGAGFLGLHLARFFRQKCHQVTLVDIAPYPKLEYKNLGKLLTTDVRDKAKLSQAVKGQDVVVHAAAALPLWNRQDIFTTNMNGTENVLDLSLKFGIKRVIYISSTAVYGVPKKHPIVETDPLVGVGAYGESKIKAEDFCRQYQKKGLPVTILRPKTFVGTERLGVFEILFDWIHDGKKIPMIGSGNNRYQLLDVDDLVNVIYLCALSRDKKLNDFFNVAAEKFGTVASDLAAVFTSAHSGSKLLPLPAKPIKLALRFFELIGISPLYQWVYDTADKDSFASIDKLQKTLHWQPKFSNAQALVKAFSWYQKNYKEIKSRKSGVTHTAGWKQGVLGLFKRFL